MYKALIAGINLSCEVGALHLSAISDSQRATNHVKGDYQTKEHLSVKYLQHILKMENELNTLEMVDVRHEENIFVDLLAKLTNTKLSCLNRTRI